MHETLLAVRDLSISLTRDAHTKQILSHVDLSIRSGEIMGLIGLTGSGKTTLGLSLARLLSKEFRVSGDIMFEGRDIAFCDDAQLARMRWKKIAYIFQEPYSSFNPVFTVGWQIEEAVRFHMGMPRTATKNYAYEVLRALEFREPQRVYASYPHELSGGMCQRAMIAMAIAARPRLLVADEPTSSLDVTTAARIMALLGSLQKQHGFSVLFITHQIALLKDFAHTLAVLHEGKIVESGACNTVFADPQHPFTKSVLSPLRVVPSSHASGERISLRVEGVGKTFTKDQMRVGGETKVCALRDISASIAQGEVLAVVGETGSGKTTLGKIILGLLEPDKGRVTFEGDRRSLGYVPQDSFGSFDPRWRVKDILAEPLILEGLAREGAYARAKEFLKKFAISPCLDKFPYQLSGGEKQKIAIARALITAPTLLVLDEPIASIDAPHRGEIIALLQRLREEYGFSVLFITHDFSTLGAIANRVIVLYQGKIVEEGPTQEVMRSPRHPYTKALIASAELPS
jgi:ABC-type glutathione transport system ATPase component